MTEEKRGLRIFIQYWVLIALLAGFNLYQYFRVGSTLSLVVALAGIAIFIGWAFFYFYYVRARP